MVKLDRKKDPKSYFLVAGMASIALAVPFQRLGIPYPLLWLGLIVSPCIALWFRFGNKPAAWIIGDTLYILNGLFSPLRLTKPEINKLYYSKQSKSEHLLLAKLKNESTQKFLIHDKQEHLHENRLENFINQNFIPIEEEYIETSKK